MADEIAIIRIIPDGVDIAGTPSSNKSSDSGGMGSGFFKGIGGALSSAMKALGIGSAAAMVAVIASQFKGLISVIGSILKMVGYLLKPISDVVMTLLMPILFIMKPFVILANQVMAPFIKLAMGVMREGQQMIAGGNVAGGMAAFAGAGTIALQGLSSVIVAVSAELLKLVVDIIFQGLGLILGALITGVGNILASLVEMIGFSGDGIRQTAQNMSDGLMTFLNSGADVVNSGIDTVAAGASTALATSAAEIGDAFGVNTDNFRISAAENITNVFDGALGLNAMMEKMLGVTNDSGSFKVIGKDALTEAISGEDGINNKFVTEMSNFKSNGSTKIREAVNSFNSEFDRLKKFSNNSSDSGFSNSLVGMMAKAIKNIGDDEKWWS